MVSRCRSDAWALARASSAANPSAMPLTPCCWPSSLREATATLKPSGRAASWVSDMADSSSMGPIGGQGVVVGRDLGQGGLVAGLDGLGVLQGLGRLAETTVAVV